MRPLWKELPRSWRVVDWFKLSLLATEQGSAHRLMSARTFTGFRPHPSGLVTEPFGSLDTAARSKRIDDSRPLRIVRAGAPYNTVESNLFECRNALDYFGSE